MEEKSKSLQDLNRYKKEIIELKNSLNQLDTQKETAFKEKDQYSKQISNLIKKVKNVKGMRDKFTKHVKEEKGEREKYNKEVRQRIDELKILNKEKAEVQKKLGITENPSNLKRQIEVLDTKVETEVMSFDKEKGIMKEIKELKKRMGESGKLSEVFEKSAKLSKEVDKLKKKSEEKHKNVQSEAKESQEKHEEVIEISKEVDELRARENMAFRIFSELKKQFVQANNKLKEKLLKLGKFKNIPQEQKISVKPKENKIKFVEKNNNATRLKDKKREVEEKIRKGEKLTTQDLLVMQEN